MKTKRLKKLLMGMGLSRNQVNSMVQSQRTEGSKNVTNEFYYLAVQWNLSQIDPEVLPYIKTFVLG